MNDISVKKYNVSTVSENPDYLQMPVYNSLTPSEISTILQWINQEYPE